MNDEFQFHIEMESDQLMRTKGLTRREIARRLQWPEGTVHTRARLALQNLRGQLDELGLSVDELP